METYKIWPSMKKYTWKQSISMWMMTVSIYLWCMYISVTLDHLEDPDNARQAYEQAAQLEQWVEYCDTQILSMWKWQQNNQIEDVDTSKSKIYCIIKRVIHNCLSGNTGIDTALQIDTSPLNHFDLIIVWTTKCHYLLTQFLM